MKVDSESWSIEDIVEVALNPEVKLSSGDESWRQLIQSGADFLNRYWQQHGNVYGVTTGYGDSCTVTIPRELVLELPLLCLGRSFRRLSVRWLLEELIRSLCVDSGFKIHSQEFLRDFTAQDFSFNTRFLVRSFRSKK